jgi:tRNA (cmo5U34)-methyltransferase
MGVASHLGIKTEEYDRQILTFIPYYDEILDAAAAALDALDRPARTLLDLGTGSGALAARCAKRLRGVRVVGIDSDAAMLAMASKRLGKRLTPVVGNFESATFPPCDVVTASFSLHHITSPAAKRAVFARAFAALRSGGLLVDADSVMNDSPRLAKRDYDGWRLHLATTYGAAGARKFLRAWADEDTYLPLDLEVSLLRDVGFAVDIAWRKGAFAVLAARKARR